MAGVGELLASAALKQLSGMLGTAIWKAIASQLKLGDELQALKDTVDSIHEGMVKAEKRSTRDGDVSVWMRKLKEAAYDMEDMIMKFEGDILRKRHGSQSNNSTTEISIPVNLRWTMPGELRKMKQRLEEIKNLRWFDLMSDTSSDDQDVIQMRATGPCLEEGIVGRENEKAELMKLLREDRKHDFIPIYGIGGLGKTTLARIVFDDSTTRSDFDIRVWIYVSPKFSNEKIGRSIISQVDGQSNQYDLSSVQMRVEMVLNGKKYLVVLDDLWEDNTSNLDQLKAMLKGGARGSKIIVTTRSEQVAKWMNKDLPFKLDALPYDECLKLFKHKAFQNGSEEFDEFLKVGEKIIKKCGGVPLAVKSLGYRLLNMPLRKWEETLKSELWEGERDPTTATASTAVLPSLKISYYYMPYYLRPCFVYFSAFPKGFIVEKRDLIHRWIALGFVSTINRAEEYLQELRQMSFLEATSASTTISAGYSKPNNHDGLLFKMHDLVHELARSVAVEEVAICDANHRSSGAKKDICRYMLFSNFKDRYLKCKDMPSKARAIHFSDCTGYQPSRDAFSETKWLRVLDLSSMQIELPRSMRNLHHLQVLNLSENTSLVKLHSPTSICDFQKLRYLDIHGCSNLRELPDNIHILQDLKHLDLSGCTRLQKLPSRFGELQMLSFLNLSCSQLEMLPDTFSQLKNLEYLNLSFCSKLKRLHTLSLKRMKGLLYLNMSGCTWLEALPEFYGDNDGCLNLEILDLSDCDRLINLSESFARLNELRFLSLSGCSRIQNIIRFLGRFVKLEYLNLSGVPLSGFDVRKDSEAPSSSTWHSSGYSGEDMSLKMLNGVIKSMPRLEYLVAGGLSLFSKEGIHEEFLTLPDFVVSTRSGGNSSNISLLQNILDPTHRELNIRCLEAVMSAEEAATVELGRKHRLASLSLEWSSLECYAPSEPTEKTMAVLEHLKPHRNLKHLTIKGYNHSTFPRWIMGICYTLPNLVKLVLSDLVWCDHLPTPANLSNLEELEIRNMPRLKGACLAPSPNLRRLSLFALERGFTLRFIQERSKDFQGIHGMEIDHAEESETPDVTRTQSGDPSQENRETEQAIMKRNRRKNAGVPARSFEKKAKMLDLPVSSPTPSAAKETVPTLCCLKVEYCQDLKLYSSINFDEYFINESEVEFIADTWFPALKLVRKMHFKKILARKMHFKNCSHPTATLLKGVNIRTDELVVDGCDKKFLNYFVGNGYKAIQKLKITNSEEFDLEYMPSIPSLQEVEFDCVNKIPIDTNDDYLGCIMDKLKKTLFGKYKLKEFTSSSYKNCLYTDPGEVLSLAIPQIQHIKIINEEKHLADFRLLHENLDFRIMELCLANLELVKKATEVDPGDLARYDQLRRLSLIWSRQPDGQADNYARANFDQGLPKIDTDDSAVLQRLQPHANLSMLGIRGYQGATFCAWVSNANLYVPNLVKIELVDIPRCERLPSLGQLANLEELHISNMPNIREVDSSFYGGKHPFRRLRKLHIYGIVNLEVWSTNLEPYAGQISWNDDEQQLQGDEIFPSLEHLIVNECPRLTLDSGFQGCIRRIIESCSNLSLSSEEVKACFIEKEEVEAYSQLASKLLILEAKICGFNDHVKVFQYLIVEGYPRLSLGSAFQGCIRRIIESCSEVQLSPGKVIGSSLLSRLLDAETNILGFSGGLELLQHGINLSKLTIKSNSDLTALPGGVQKCQNLRCLQILDCWNFSVLPDWLGDLTSLEELEVHAPKLQCLPHAIKGLTSLKTLTLKQCNYKLRERCSISGEGYDKRITVQGLEVFIGSSIGMALLEKTTSRQLIELNIKGLEHLSSLEAEKINLVGKEELQLLSLEWSSNCDMIDIVALEKLQPHQNLRRLCIKNYPINAGFPRWMQSLPNLVSMELSNVQAGHLHLDHLQNLEDLQVSSFSSCAPFDTLGRRAISPGFDYDRSLLRISSTQPHKKLRIVTMARVAKLVWESSCLPSENLFPALEYLEIDCCLDVTFEPSIPWTARYIISGSKQYREWFNWPSFKRVMGPSTSASSSKMEIKNSKNISSGPLDSLGQLDIEELTVDSCMDSIPLPECIWDWKSLRKLEILNCEDIKELPDRLGDMASLRELKVETYWMKTLPQCIGRLTSLQTLALLKCTKKFKQRCSKGGDDWSKIKHIDNLIVEELKL